MWAPDVVATVIAVFLATAMTISAAGKLFGMPQVVAGLDRAAVPHRLYPLLATVQVVGALGLVVGIWIAWPGVAAGVGFFVYFAVAVVLHVRADDARGAGAPALLGALGLTEAVLRAAA